MTKFVKIQPCEESEIERGSADDEETHHYWINPDYVVGLIGTGAVTVVCLAAKIGEKHERTNHICTYETTDELLAKLGS